MSRVPFFPFPVYVYTKTLPRMPFPCTHRCPGSRFSRFPVYVYTKTLTECHFRVHIDSCAREISTQKGAEGRFCGYPQTRAKGDGNEGVHTGPAGWQGGCENTGKVILPVPGTGPVCTGREQAGHGERTGRARERTGRARGKSGQGTEKSRQGTGKERAGQCGG